MPRPRLSRSSSPRIPISPICFAAAVPPEWSSWWSAATRRGCRAMVRPSRGPTKAKPVPSPSLLANQDHDDGSAGEDGAEGRVSLSDPLQKFAPHGVIVPDRTVRGLSGGRSPCVTWLRTPRACRAKLPIPRALPAISPFPTITFAGNGFLAIACALFLEPPRIIPTLGSTCSQTP